MALSGRARQQMLRMQTQARFPYLIEITHGVYGTYRYANCDEDLTFEGETYLANCFSITPPDVQEQSVGNGTLGLSIVDQEWVEKIRGTQERAKLRFVAAIEADGAPEPIDDYEMTLTEASWTPTELQWTMMFDEDMSLLVPVDMATAQKVPGCA